MGRRSQWPCAVLLLGGVLLLTLGVRRALRTRGRAGRERLRGSGGSCVLPGRGARRGRGRGSPSARSTPSRRSHRCGRPWTRRSPTSLADSAFAGDVPCGRGRRCIARCSRRDRSISTLPGAGAELHAALPPRSRARRAAAEPAIRSCSTSAADRSSPGSSRQRRTRAASPAWRRWCCSAGLRTADRVGLAGADAPPRARAGRRSASHSRAARCWSRRRRSARAMVLSTLRHEPRRCRGGRDLGRVPRRPAAVGTRSRARLGADRGRDLRAGHAAARGGGRWRTVAAPCGSAARLARAGALLVLAVLLLWMPEVPLDLALVSCRRRSGVHRRRRSRAYLIRSIDRCADPVDAAD